MKKCKICNLNKEITLFAKCRSAKDGLQIKCKDCDNTSKKERYKKNRESEKIRCLNYYHINRSKILPKKRQFYVENCEQEKARCAKQREKNPNYILNWKKQNKEKCLIYNRNSESKRRAILNKAMPLWLNKEQLKQIYHIYKNCPQGYEVDHVIPLRNRVVTGLHVPWNLQYLTKSENKKKKNKLLLGGQHA